MGLTGLSGCLPRCIDYYTTQCSYDASNSGKQYSRALRAFAQCAEKIPEPAGYCHGSLTSAAKLSNAANCKSASNKNIAFHIRIPISISSDGAGTYMFRMHADYGMGSFIGVDGAEFSPGNTWGHVQLDPVSLTPGDHEFESLGFEDSGDHHSELEVHLPCDKYADPWRVVVAGKSACMQCKIKSAASCSANTVSDGTCKNGVCTGGSWGTVSQHSSFSLRICVDHQARSVTLVSVVVYTGMWYGRMCANHRWSLCAGRHFLSR